MIALQLLINGLIAGSIYALIATGFSLIYTTNRFIHFAHGASATVSAYLLFTLFTLFGIPFYISAVLTIIGGGVLGWLMYVALYRPLKRQGSSNAILLVSSIGLMILLENLMLLIFGADVKTLQFITVKKGLEVGGAIITPLQIVIIAITALLLLALWILIKKTRLGTVMRAAADNPELAEISGINVDAVAAKGFILGSAIAGLAAILIALEQNIEPAMGTGLIVKGFTGAVVGGITSVPGAVFGSYLLGLAENFGIWYLPSGYKDAIAFVLLFVFLLWRPTGIFGISKGARE